MSEQRQRDGKGHFAVSPRERVLLAAVDTGQDFEELRALADTADVEVVGEFVQRRSDPSPTTYFGQGKAQELAHRVTDDNVATVIVDDELSPTQQRNLEEAAHCKVIDRTRLILDIFAQRAHTREGKLQVELAQLNYLLPRVTSLYTEFERQQGGIGMRGPGETKLDVDRQRIRKRISDLETEIEEVKKQRGRARQSRSRLPFPSAALVGYTSAGKSTLLNVLSGSEVLVDPKLFATLDPTTRRVLLPDGWSMLLTDTVGFIQRLPHHLVASFRATLEEVLEADLLLHVVDASRADWAQQMEAVETVLEELGAAGKPMVVVLNKADLLPDTFALRELVAQNQDWAYISAANREGLQQLLTTVTRALESTLVPLRLSIPYAQSQLLALCHESGKVQSVAYESDAVLVEGRFSRDIAGRLRQYQA